MPVLPLFFWEVDKVHKMLIRHLPSVLSEGVFAKRNSHLMRPTGMKRFIPGTLVVLFCLPAIELAAGNIIITVDTTHPRNISPWIYGINAYQSISNAPRNLTLNRTGGNRWTAYNWENNASNAGSDWGPYINDDSLSSSSIPAEAIRTIINADRVRSNASLMTVQLQGYVSADKNGNVNTSDPNHLAARFKQVAYQKKAPFTNSPSTSDTYVYMDEFLWTVRSRFTNDIYADPVCPTFVSLDNEPELWNSTHFEIQPQPITPDEFIQKSIHLCRALKTFDPKIQLFGPVHYGFNGLVNWKNAPGYSSSYWFTDQYLRTMKAASKAAGVRLLDVYDFHWYSEAAVSGTRIISLTSSNLNDAQIQAIVQSPRSLWDATYREIPGSPTTLAAQSISWTESNHASPPTGPEPALRLRNTAMVATITSPAPLPRPTTWAFSAATVSSPLPAIPPATVLPSFWPDTKCSATTMATSVPSAISRSLPSPVILQASPPISARILFTPGAMSL